MSPRRMPWRAATAAACAALAALAAGGCGASRRAAAVASAAPAEAQAAAPDAAPADPPALDPAAAPAPGAAPAEGVPAAPAAPAWTEPDRTQPPWSQTPVPPIEQGQVLKDVEALGEHLRIGTESGVVHAWRPQGYRRRGAGTVIYLHGYYTDVDQAWADHRLAEQFRASGRNALFLAVEAPSWNGEEPYWKTLDALFETLERVAKLRVPSGPVVVAGHSGAFRGIVPWLTDPRIVEVLLLDGLYQSERAWADWLDGAPRGTRRLVLVGGETAARAEAWLPSRRGAIFLPRIPGEDRGLEPRERRTPLLYMRSQLDHMAIIQQGTVLPLLLRDGRLRSHPAPAPAHR